MGSVNYSNKMMYSSLKRRAKRKKLKINEAFIKKMVDLKDMVENINKQPNIALRGSTYKELDKRDMYTFKDSGWK